MFVTHERLTRIVCYFGLVYAVMAVGFAFQTLQYIQDYFKYKTQNRIEMVKDYVVKYPAVDICHEVVGGSLAAAMESSASQIFSTIQTRRAVLSLNNTLSAAIFKYLMQGMLCTSIRINETALTIHELGNNDFLAAHPDRNINHLSSNSLVYAEMRDDYYNQLKPGHSIHVTLHAMENINYNPHDNLVPSPGKGEQVLSSFTYQNVEEHRLTSPYETNCVNYYGSMTQDTCLALCMPSLLGIYQSFHRITSPMIFEWPDLQQREETMTPFFPSTSAVLNSSFVEDAQEYCWRSCNFTECTSQRYAARLLSYTRLKVSRFAVIIERPEESIRIVHSASIVFYDFLSVMLNAASLWFAFCPLLIAIKLQAFCK